MWAVHKILDCLPCDIPFIKKARDRAKKEDASTSNDKLNSLESGTGDADDWEFDSWDNKARKQPAPSNPAPTLQRLDDFDGMSPVIKNESADEPDFFGTLGLKPQYQPPKQAEVKKAPSKTVWTPDEEDEDIDIEGWESGKVRKGKKKLAATRVT